VLKWSVDGFSLLCIIGNESESQTYKNYYSNEDLNVLNKLSQLFLHLYYYQHSELAKMAQLTLSDGVNLLDDFGIEFNDINFDQNKSFHSSQYGIS
jgi:hypothetical protein